MKQAALLDLALAVSDRFRALLERGVTASRIEEVDLSEATRVRDETGAADARTVEAVQSRLLAALGGLA